jgi:hypothetical protein
MADKHVSHPHQVVCPRCGMRRSLSLHRVMSDGARGCPWCWVKDRIEVPMVTYPPHREIGSMLEQRVVSLIDEAGRGSPRSNSEAPALQSSRELWNRAHQPSVKKSVRVKPTAARLPARPAHH